LKCAFGASILDGAKIEHERTADQRESALNDAAQSPGEKPGPALHTARVGLQVMRVLGRNMARLLKSIRAVNLPVPAPEAPLRTDFIR
jgi:hypothetical protein